MSLSKEDLKDQVFSLTKEECQTDFERIFDPTTIRRLYVADVEQRLIDSHYTIQKYSTQLDKSLILALLVLAMKDYIKNAVTITDEEVENIYIKNDIK